MNRRRYEALFSIEDFCSRSSERLMQQWFDKVLELNGDFLLD